MAMSPRGPPTIFPSSYSSFSFSFAADDDKREDVDTVRTDMKEQQDDQQIGDRGTVTKQLDNFAKNLLSACQVCTFP